MVLYKQFLCYLGNLLSRVHNIANILSFVISVLASVLTNLKLIKTPRIWSQLIRWRWKCHLALRNWLLSRFPRLWRVLIHCFIKSKPIIQSVWIWSRTGKSPEGFRPIIYKTLLYFENIWHTILLHESSIGIWILNYISRWILNYYK